MKHKKRLLITALALLAFSISGVNLINHVKGENKIVAKAATYEEKDLTTVAFSNTPVAGWGNVNINKSCTGSDLVVNGITYPKGIGTHPDNDPNSVACDIEYDISTLATEYEFFEALVAMVDGGDNCLKFTVLVDGVIKDFIYWRKGFNDGNPLWLRVNITGGLTLTLRTQCTKWGHANGTCAWLAPRLYNPTGDQVFASDITDRYADTNGTGWSYLSGDADLLYLYPLLDQRVNGSQFSVFKPFGVNSEYKKGFGTQLKNVNYATYAADKTNSNSYAGISINIENRGFTFFNSTASVGAGNGAYVDVWLDGVEVYHSELVSAANPGLVINVPIPATAKVMQIRVIANTGFEDGLVDLAGAQFLKENEYLYTRYATQTLAPESAFPNTRGFGQIGKPLTIYDSALDASVATQKGLFIHVNESYTFPVTSLTYDTLSGTIGCFGPETGHGTNNLKATFTYSDATTVITRSNNFSRTNSNIPFRFFFNPTGLTSIKLELEGELACSASALNLPLLSNSTAIAQIVSGLKMEQWIGASVRESGNCSEDFNNVRALVLALDTDDLNYFKFTNDTNIVAARTRYEAWALALGEQAYANAPLSPANITSNISDAITTSALLLLIAASLSLIIIVGRKKKYIH